MSEENYTVVPDVAAEHMEILVVRNAWELVIFMTYICLSGLVSIGGNSFVLCLIARHRSLQQPHFFIIAAYAASDIALSSTVSPMFLSVLLGRGSDVSDMACAVHGSITMALAFVQIHMLGGLALERFFFFCHPLKYSRLFTPLRTATLVAVPWMFSFAFAVPIQIVSGRQLFVTVMSCQVSKAMLVLQLQVGFYILPTFLVVSYCLWHIALVLRTQQVAPASQQVSFSASEGATGRKSTATFSVESDAVSGATESTSYPRGSRRASEFPPKIQGKQTTTSGKASVRKKARLALRVILLTSGAFYASYLPALLIRWVIFSQLGASWPLIESGENLWMTLILRVSNTTLVVLPSALNPLSYFYTHKVLRQALWKTLCRWRTSVTPQIEDNPGTSAY